MKLVIAFLSVLACVGTANATGIKGAGSYGTAGCGLGSMVFGNEAGGIQILAATTNGTVGSQTFGITSGTSNCGNGAFAKAEVNSFIQSNTASLENDVVRGQGETLSTLNNMLGCDSQFSGVLQQNYKNVFTNGAANTDKIVALSQSCRG